MKTGIHWCLCFASALILDSCKLSTDGADVKESIDSLNDPGLFDAKSYPYEKLKQSAFLKGSLDEKPWTDSYWPLSDAGMALRWIDEGKKFDLDANPNRANYEQIISDKISKAIADAKSKIGKSTTETALVSPAEKIDLALGRKDFPLLSAELMTFAANQREFKDIDWGWMGHCHGWAAAAYMEKTPKNGVLMKNTNGQEVLFTPGDIRGVLTKAAAEYGYNGQDRFLGSRCNDPADIIPRDRFNRVIDASLGIYKSGDYFSVSTSLKIQVNGWNGTDPLNDANLGVVGFLGTRLTKTSPLIWISAASGLDAQKNIYGVNVYSTKTINGELYRDQILVGQTDDDVGVFVDANGKPIKESGVIKKDVQSAKSIWAKATASAPAALKAASKKLAFKYWKECRDANPGSFHLVLVSSLSKGGRGSKPAKSFVMDITRDEQVWNHPVYAFTSWMGQPTKLTEDGVSDPLKSWRAKGTTQIVDVYTRVEYAVENGPKITYQSPDETTTTMMLRYTLELNDKGIVLGGEWHPTDIPGDKTPTPLTGKALLQNLKQLTTSNSQWESLEHPDFIWSPAATATLSTGNLVPTKLTKKLTECSQKEATGSIQIMGTRVPTVSCSF